MYEDFDNLLHRGFETWRANLQLCVPFVLQGAATVLVMAILAGSLAYLSLSSPTGSTDPFSITSDIWISAIPIAFAGIIMIFVASSFFTAGAVGMAAQANIKGWAELDVMWSEGMDHWKELFMATILIMLFVLCGMLLILLATVGLVMGSFGSGGMPPEVGLEDLSPAAIGAILVGTLVLVIFVLTVSLVLAVTPFAIVIDGLKPVEAIYRSLNFFRDHRLEVLLIWLIVTALSVDLAILGQFLGGNSEGSLWPVAFTLINPLVIAPLSTLWWAGLYMSRTGKKIFSGEVVYL